MHLPSHLAQQVRSNSALGSHANHHNASPHALVQCPATQGSWWALWWGSLYGMQGVRGSNPLSSTSSNQGKRSARHPSRRHNPSKPQSERWQARHQGIRDRRHQARDLSAATLADGHAPEPYPARPSEADQNRRYGPRADYPVAGAWAARACGIAVTWVGRPAPLYAGSCVARRGTCLPRGGVVGHVACRHQRPAAATDAYVPTGSPRWRLGT